MLKRLTVAKVVVPLLLVAIGFLYAAAYRKPSVTTNGSSHAAPERLAPGIRLAARPIEHHGDSNRDQNIRRTGFEDYSPIDTDEPSVQFVAPRPARASRIEVTDGANRGRGQSDGQARIERSVRATNFLQQASPALTATFRSLTVAADALEKIDFGNRGLVYPLGGNTATVNVHVEGTIAGHVIEVGRSFGGPSTHAVTLEDFTTDVDVPAGLHQISLVLIDTSTGNRTPIGQPLRVFSNRDQPRIIRVQPMNLTEATGPYEFRIDFAPDNPLKALGQQHLPIFAIRKSGQTTSVAASSLHWHSRTNQAVVSFREIEAGNFHLIVKATDSQKLTDVFDRDVPDSEFPFIKNVLTTPPGVLPGLSGTSGPAVEFPEYTKFRELRNGFNPSDRVETRVSRLYFYRDAHRVTQIINRKARSFNRSGVDMAFQQASAARNKADQLTGQRRSAERQAKEDARKTRQAETQLQQAEQDAANAQRELLLSAREFQRLNRDGADETEIEQVKTTMQSQQKVATAARRQADELRHTVEHLREVEVESTERSLQLEGDEELARADQFRREVAASQADPDTYAPGEPNSQDPVAQVSASVIGEGLIHLRGPLKGINVIRMMINQMDAPVGQTRIGIHTVQYNGEDGERLEIVADRVQKHIDHARFLTMRSTEMLRQSVVKVAADRASEAWQVYPGNDQAARDQRYLYNFFGKDFVDELHAMDSEFLKSGNKLLSLHSMDTTSLASALAVLSLAKNNTRMAILEHFEGALMGELPLAEQRHFENSLVTCENKKCKKRCRCNEFLPLSHNAKFESLRSFFNTSIGHDEIMTPLQREFTALAQIFKARLIVEMELKQRVMERAVIEERLGNYQEELQNAKNRDKTARDDVHDARRSHRKNINKVRQELTALVESVNDSINTIEKLRKRQKELGDLIKGLKDGSYATIDGPPKRIADLRRKFTFANSTIARTYRDAIASLDEAYTELSKYKYEAKIYRDAYFETGRLLDEIRPGTITDDEAVEKVTKEVDQAKIEKVRTNILFLTGVVSARAKDLKTITGDLLIFLTRQNVDVAKAFAIWTNLKTKLDGSIWSDDDRANPKTETIKSVHQAFVALLGANEVLQSSLQEAELARRPLDHKKFLDMLIDDMEDKYIELLEGTRAHTANIDNYIKRVATALEDDFNAQFYHPAFRCVRQASRFRDVTFGQVETTTVLANNREFAKVSPSATMEFDLPARSLLVTEGMQAGKALIDDYGALVADPSFLALTALGAGQPTSSVANGGGQYSTVRNALPGLGSATQESILSQSGPGRNQFGSALENLIPDPAIYKFETGTGFEIRPVIQPDGQAVVFDFNYMYTTNVYEPVRADEKHLGRVKRHQIHTDVQLSNYELRPVSRYQVALKASRTARGVPLLEDIPIAGVLFRPLPQQESSLQQNLILAQATIYPTLFDLMGLRWAPAVTDLDPLRLSNDEYLVRGRHRFLQNRVFDFSSAKVDDFLRIPEGERRADLYRTQQSIPRTHPNGYRGPGLNLRDSTLEEGYSPLQHHIPSQFVPAESAEGTIQRRGKSPSRSNYGFEGHDQGATFGGSIDGEVLPGQVIEGAVSDEGILNHQLIEGEPINGQFHDGHSQGGQIQGSEFHGTPVHGSPVHGSPVHGSPVHGSPVHGGQVIEGDVIYERAQRGAVKHGRSKQRTTRRRTVNRGNVHRSVAKRRTLAQEQTPAKLVHSDELNERPTHRPKHQTLNQSTRNKQSTDAVSKPSRRTPVRPVSLRGDRF